MKTRAIKLVALRELREGLRNRTYMITFAISLILIIALAVLPTILGGDDDVQLGVLGSSVVTADELTQHAERYDVELAVRDVGDRNEAEAALRNGELDVVLVDDQELLVHERINPTVRAVLADAVGQQTAVDRLQQLGLDAGDVSEVLAAVGGLTVTNLEEPAADVAFAFAFAGTILLLMGVTFFASTVLMGVVEEKSSRVVEVVLGAMRPTQLLTGKLLGISTLAFAQVTILVVVGVAAVRATGAVELPETTGATVAAVIGWFVLGFASYSVVYAAAGSLASRVEDAQSSAGPIGFLLFIAYFSTFLVVLPNPDGTAARIISVLPFLAPLTMPARVALGAVTPLEMVLAVGLTIAAVAGCVVLAGKIYQRSVLRTERLTWTAALRGGDAR